MKDKTNIGVSPVVMRHEIWLANIPASGEGHVQHGPRPVLIVSNNLEWKYTNLVIVDEASMMTLEMLAGILNRCNKECRIVLLGDNNQLLSVGSGNVIPDLISLGFPCKYLEANHRQNADSAGLLKNVSNFKYLTAMDDLDFDQSFTLKEMNEFNVRNALIEEAVKRYKNGENVQVLSPYNKATGLSVEVLNNELRKDPNSLV